MTCANNCKGVDPNSVIIGGTALLAVASVGKKKYCRVHIGVPFFLMSASPAELLLQTVFKKVFQVHISLGGLGGLTPGIIGVGAAGTLGGAAVVNQMMDRCPASRPCPVDIISTLRFVSYIFTLNR